jgi:uncharacterized alkaline shock family protein YloU
VSAVDTALTTPPAGSPVPAGSVAPADDPGERGQTTIADRVLERIAVQAVGEVGAAGGSARRMLGVAVGGAGLDKDAQVAVTVTGGKAALAVQLSVAYPASIAGTARQARQQLIQRIEELTGHPVSRVDITVTAVHAAVAPARRVL